MNPLKPLIACLTVLVCIGITFVVFAAKDVSKPYTGFKYGQIVSIIDKNSFFYNNTGVVTNSRRPLFASEYRYRVKIDDNIEKEFLESSIEIKE